MESESPSVERPISPLRHLHNTQTSLEKFRISIGNRVSAIERGDDDVKRPVPMVYQRVLDLAKEMEHEIDTSIAEELKQWSVYNEWLKHVKGIGPSLSGQMLALLLPPLPTKGPSSWYKAAGLVAEVRQTCGKMMDSHFVIDDIEMWRCPDHPNQFSQVDGVECPEPTERRLPRPRAGEGKITYHPWLRRCLYNVATSFVRSGGYYREVYDRAKAQMVQYHSGDPNWPAYRIDSAARWKMIKLFLSHLWEAWCDAEGIQKRVPYVVERLGHQYIPRPMPREDGKKV